jgi:integrase
MLNHDVLPSWRNRQVEDIKRVDVRALLEGIAEHAPIQANRTAQLLSKIFNFAIDRELIESTPAHRMLTPGGPERVRDRVLSSDELRAVWTALENESAKDRDLFRLALLASARKAEVGDIAWHELDLDGGWWTIPAARTKNKREHRLPIVGEALAILRRLQAEAPADAIQVFCGDHNGKPTATVQVTLERIKARTGVKFRFHDLRPRQPP